MSILTEKWYVVGSPWGDGTWINAGSEDPHGGQFVVDCETFNESGPRGEAAAKLAAHIVLAHNLLLEAAQRKMRMQLTAPQRNIEVGS